MAPYAMCASEGDEERAAPVVQHQEPRRLDQRDLVGRGLRRAHARMHDRQQHVDQNRRR